MLLIIRGVNGNQDLSQGYVIRETFKVEAAIGRRMDICNFTLFDPDGTLNIPQRAEVIVYDFPATSLPAGWTGWTNTPPIVDPPPSNRTVTTLNWDDPDMRYETSPPTLVWDGLRPLSGQYLPANWTPRMFAGYIAAAVYRNTGGLQREIDITCQDYTLLNKYTIINKAYAPDALHTYGWSDAQIIQDVYLRYRPDIDVTFVNPIVQLMPSISFPSHSIDQFFTRLIKVSTGYYRIDYYKRMFYGLLGSRGAPFGISDQPGTVINLLAGSNDSNFATGVGHWAGGPTGFWLAGTSTVTWDQTQGQGSSTTSLKVVTPGAVAAEGAKIYPQLGSVTISPGQSYTLSAWVKAPAGKYLQLGGRSVLNDPNGDTDGTPSNSGDFLTTGSWQQVFVNIIASFNGAFADFAVRTSDIRAAQAVTFNVDNVILAGPVSVASEGLTYNPDATNVVNRVWVVGNNYPGPSQAYRIAPAPDGVAFSFPLPAKTFNPRAMKVTVNGVDQGLVGVIGTDGTLDNQAGFAYNAIVSQAPAQIAFKQTPPAAAVIVLTGVFLYPLLAVYTDNTRVAAMNGLILEKIVRDKRIDDLALAQAVAQAHLASQATARGQGSALLKTRSMGGTLLQPGMAMLINNQAIFQGGVLANGTNTLNALVTKLETYLTDDTSQPYELHMTYADRPDYGDDDLFDHLLTEQARMNAAVEQSDINDFISDSQLFTDTPGFQAEGWVITSLTLGSVNYDAAATKWEYFRWQ